jgi:hypothetical protein
LRSPASCSGAIGCPSTIGISSTGRRADAAIDVVGHGAPVSSGARCGKSRAGVSSRRPRRLQLANDVVLPFAFSYFECTHKMQNAVRLFAIKNSGHDADSQCVSWSSRGRPLAGVVRGASRTSLRRRAKASRMRSAGRPERRRSAAPANAAFRPVEEPRSPRSVHPAIWRNRRWTEIFWNGLLAASTVALTRQPTAARELTWRRSKDGYDIGSRRSHTRARRSHSAWAGSSGECTGRCDPLPPFKSAI